MKVSTIWSYQIKNRAYQGAAMEKYSLRVEKSIIASILSGALPRGAQLKSERELALQHSVTRPVIREALQRLAQDGWIIVSQKKVSVVNDFWLNGNLNILTAISVNPATFPLELVSQLLEFRVVLAAEYTEKAVSNDALALVALLASACKVGNDPEHFSTVDWQLHKTMAVLSGNKLYPLMLNSFESLYLKMGSLYFSCEMCRDASRNYYKSLLQAAVQEDSVAAAAITRQAMQESFEFWQRLADAKER